MASASGASASAAATRSLADIRAGIRSAREGRRVEVADILRDNGQQDGNPFPPDGLSREKVMRALINRWAAYNYVIDHGAFIFLLDREGRYPAFFPPGTTVARMAVMVREALAQPG